MNLRERLPRLAYDQPITVLMGFVACLVVGLVALTLVGLGAFGIVTYELVTGRLPFTGETPMSIAYKHLSDRVPAPSSLVADVIMPPLGLVIGSQKW